MLGMPEAASSHAENVDTLIHYVHYFMFALAIVWGIFFLYCLLRFRSGANPRADYHGMKGKASTWLEGAVILFEAYLLVFLAFPIWGSWVGDYPDQGEATTVRVVGEQFIWNFHYAGNDGKFGKTSASLVDTQSNPLGLDRANDPEAKDDVVSQVLHLPVNKPALLTITSKDVIHSFKVPQFRVTQDATPGLEIPITFTPTKEGDFEVVCSQLCGIGHYRMKGQVKIESEDTYSQWIDELSTEASETDPDDVW